MRIILHVVAISNLHVLENYPSLAEGNGLENRQVEKSARGFESHILLTDNRVHWARLFFYQKS